jgi:cytochrome c peroxidase
MSLILKSYLTKRMFRRACLLSSALLVPAFVACQSDDEGGGQPGTAGNGAGTAGNGAGTAGSGAGTAGSGAGTAGHGAGTAGTDPGPDPASASAVRAFISTQVGGLDKLTVPATDDAIPVPPDDSARPGRYKTTPAKTYLGKLLFHDPVRTARVNTNLAQPLDLPAGTSFGGTVLNAAEPNVDQIVAATKQTGSCGSCHIGEAATKAGQLLNFNTGGEGRGYTDADGNFIPRRRPMEILTKLRAEPLFPGDQLVDALPTLTDIFVLNGERTVTTPALFYQNNPLPPNTTLSLTATGRLDELDSVGRLSPSLIGFAFNNRLLFGGFGGEPMTTSGALNPLNDPAGENMTLLLLDAHRMLNLQSEALLKVPAFVKLFRDAFPEEAAQADAQNDPTVLVNDQTEFRAQATFLRTVVTRDTPFDRFLAGDNAALTPSQLNGARLFFTQAQAGGAGCFGCHSGPMLNKQPNDPDVAGIGQFVEENFFNLGLGDHPVQALNAAARGRGTAYHAEDTGREEVTHNPADRFKFRSLTLRQLKDARGFFHSGSFTRLRDVVSYFNAGIPQDPTAAAAATLEPRFTYPRGNGTARGLGLTEAAISDLTDFLENGLYDPSFAKTFQPTTDDLAFSKNRPDLAALGAQDGMMLSGLAIDDNDPLARRDQGLEFLDVTARAQVTLSSSSGPQDTWLITNQSSSVIDTHLLVIVTGLPAGATINNTTATTKNGEPYFRLFLPDGVLNPGQSITVNVVRSGAPSGSYTFKLWSGQGKPLDPPPGPAPGLAPSPKPKQAAVSGPGLAASGRNGSRWGPHAKVTARRARRVTPRGRVEAPSASPPGQPRRRVALHLREGAPSIADEEVLPRGARAACSRVESRGVERPGYLVGGRVAAARSARSSAALRRGP